MLVGIVTSNTLLQVPPKNREAGPVLSARPTSSVVLTAAISMSYEAVVPWSCMADVDKSARNNEKRYLGIKQTNLPGKSWASSY